MTHWATPIIAEALKPSSLLLVGILAGVIWEFLRPNRAARAIALIFVLIFTGCAWGPFATWLFKPLEDRFPHKSLPSSVKGIVVLGGAFNVGASAHYPTMSLNYRAERMIAFAGLARKYSNATLVFTGGNSVGSKPTEARLAQLLFANIGLPRERLIFEDKSRNTRENALYSYRLVRPDRRDTWLLVTSAADMPRAVGSFWHLGWRVVPVPVDYHAETRWWGWPGLIDGLTQLDWATHEWLGLAYYRFRGWTDELIPGPMNL